MPTEEGARRAATSKQTRLRLFRIEPGTSWHVRLLHGTFYGLQAHWDRGRNRLCEVDNCKRCSARLPKVWKGYNCAEVYDSASDLWCPVVLEITESAELDMRDRTKRGQVWLLERAPAHAAQAVPVVATLIEQQDPASVSKPFEIRGVVASVYHYFDPLPPSSSSPAPARVMVAAVKGTPPPGFGDRSSAPNDTATAAQQQEFVQALRDQSKRFQMPDSNGRAKK
jgi:hypothetical protein